MCAGISDVILYAKTLHHLKKAETVVELVIFRKVVRDKCLICFPPYQHEDGTFHYYSLGSTKSATIAFEKKNSRKSAILGIGQQQLPNLVVRSVLHVKIVFYP